MILKREIDLSITGLGIVFYSDFAIRHIEEGQDFLSSDFWSPDSVAKYVNSCRIGAICTGGPGRYLLDIFNDPQRATSFAESEAIIRLGIEVRGDVLSFRDLYDFMDWSPDCPTDQRIEIASGYYRITVYSSRPPSRILGDNQRIGLYFERWKNLPNLGWQGVPDISALLE